MTEVAHAIVYEAPLKLRAMEFPLPDIGSDEMLLEVVMCGVDGSELHMFKGEVDWANKLVPLIFGDEIIGRVDRIGEQAARDRRLKPGDLVTVEARWPCNRCEYCLHGNYYLCLNNEKGRGYGSVSCAEPPHLWGGYATHCYVPPEALVYPVPEGMPIRTALLACSVLANGVRWSEMANVGEGDRLAIIGPGPQGLACALGGKARGAEVTIFGLERDSERLKRAREYGAMAVAISDEKSLESGPDGRPLFDQFHGIIETTGTQPAKDLAFKLVRPAGTIANIGIPVPAVQTVRWQDQIQKEIRMVSPFSHPHSIEPAFKLAASLLEQGIDIGDLITHVFPFAEAEQALRVAGYETDEVPVKVVLTPT